MKKFFLLVPIIIVAGGFWLYFGKNDQPKSTGTGQAIAPQAQQQTPTLAPKPGTASDSLSVVVNKKRPLPDKTYVPSDLIFPDLPVRVPGNESMQIRRVIYTDLQSMFTAAKHDGIELKISSAYRSYAYQVSLYKEWVRKSGQTEADRASARPGHSEHQTGLAVDIEPADAKCEVEQCFADTAAGIWLADHAQQYGFIIRYPKDKEPITGYTYEPWHIRYIGKPLAADYVKSGQKTLEQYYGLSAAPTY